MEKQTKTEKEYENALLKLVSEKELNKWLKENPPPKEWEKPYGKYAWAYTEMPVGSFSTWWRRNIKGWDI